MVFGDGALGHHPVTTACFFLGKMTALERAGRLADDRVIASHCSQCAIAASSVTLSTCFNCHFKWPKALTYQALAGLTPLLAMASH